MAESLQHKESPIAKNENVFGVNNKMCTANQNLDCKIHGKNASKKFGKHFPDESCSSSCVTEACSPQKVETNSLLGSYITKEYELLHLVLSHLPLGDLNAASQVCRTWHSAAVAVRRSRIHPHWLLWRTGQCQPIPLQPYRKFAEAIATVPYLAFREHVYSEPALALMFASHSVFGARVLCSNRCSCPGITSDDEDEHQHRVWEYVKAQLQPACPLICLRGFGIIGTMPDLTETIELENSRAYSILLLPEMPGVTIRTFKLDKCQVTRLQKNSRNQNSNGIEELTGISPGETVRCLLLFCREAMMLISAILQLVSCLQNRQEEIMAVAGGMISDVAGFGNCLPIMVGIALLGDGVSVASTVLGGDIKTELDADRAMQELRTHTVSSCSSSVGLMFACVGRGRHHYKGKRNVESAAFRRHFPKTPLLGYFGNGEIGFKLLPDMSTNSREVEESGPTRTSKRRRSDIPNIMHSYTTIIVHLSFTGNNTNNHNNR